MWKKNAFKGMSFGSLRAKLMSTVAMLLVASTLLVTSSYAWFVMSTAPEVTGIDTQVGANGALEIALLNDETWIDLSKLDMMDIDENAVLGSASSNLQWGNLIDLSDSSYGLSSIVLNPSRLYIQEEGEQSDGSMGYSVNEKLLKTPVYGEDGRVKGLDYAKTMALLYKDGSFTKTGHGVRAIGTAASLSVFQLGMNSARAQMSNYTAAARTAASNTLNENGNAIANIVLKKALASGTQPEFTKADVQALSKLANGINNSLSQVEMALRCAFGGFVATAASGISVDNYQAELEYIADTTHSLNDLLLRYPAIIQVISNMESYISTLSADQSKVNSSLDQCAALEAKEGTCTWSEIYGAMRDLVDYSNMTLGDKKVSEIEDEVREKGLTGSVNTLLPLITGGIVLTVPTGSGVLSDVADYAGDYTAAITVTLDLGANPPESLKAFNGQAVDAKMVTKTSYNPTMLKSSSDALSNADIAEATGSTAITDFYGYAVDLAFRTNAANSNLLLQTEPENRVYTGSGANESLQGGGSYMMFGTDVGLSTTKMIRLMNGVRVVFMDGENNVLALAKLDMQLGKSDYTVLSDEEKVATGMYAYLSRLSKSEGDYQVSDLIDAETYNALPEESHVSFHNHYLNGLDASECMYPGGQRIRAKLCLYNFKMTQAGEGEDVHNTGGITILGKRGDSVITPLQIDTAKKVTAIVYLDGSVVTNASVAANAAYSMTGQLNLQFASDATLVPAEVSALRNGEAASGGTGTGTGTGEGESGGTGGTATEPGTGDSPVTGPETKEESQLWT